MQRSSTGLLSLWIVWTGLAPAAEAQCTAQQLAQLVAADGLAQDQLGLSIAIEGDLVIVGAWLDDNQNGLDAGAAYIFERDQGGPGNFGELVKLTASDGMPADAFGWAVDIDGDTAVVGAYRSDVGGTNAGKAYVFERDQGGPGNWGEVTSLQGSDTVSGDQFGYAVTAEGLGIVVGAQRSDALGSDSGAAYVFGRNNGGVANYGELRRLTASDGAADDFFGRAVAMDGSTILVGAFGNDQVALDAGAAYVFDQNQGGVNNFGQVAKLLPADGAVGDNFGFSVGIGAGTGVVGSYRHDGFGLDAGAAYVFDRNQGGSNSWGQVQKLVGSGVGVGDVFGYSVAARANLIVVGAYLEGARGAAYTFNRNYGGPNAWGQSHRLTPDLLSINDRFGFSVDLFMVTATVGATHVNALGNNSGAGYVFNLLDSPKSYCTAGSSSLGCQGTLSAVGTPSATASSGFALMATGIEGGRQGLFFFSSNGRQANPWGNSSSFQCVTPPVRRTPVLSGGGTLGACDGSLLRDLNAYWCSSCAAPQKNPGVGSAVQVQAWYRDPQSSSNQTTALTDALEFSICP